MWHMLKGGPSEYSRVAPGVLLLETGLEHAFETGLRRVELGGGDDAYKLRWTTGVRERHLVQAFSPRPLGWADWLAFAVARPAAARARQWRLRQRERPPQVGAPDLMRASSRQASAQARVILSTKPLIRRYAATRLPSRSWPGRRSVLKAVQRICGLSNPACSSRLAQSFGD